MKSLSAQVLIIGAGPAGIAAAIGSKTAGRDVLVIDDNAAPGGQIWRASPHQEYVRRFHALGIPFIPYAQVITADYHSRSISAETPDDALQIHFEKLIIATGARELFLPFPGWTLPGVMGVGGLQAMSKSGLPVRDKTIVLAGSGPLLLAVGANLRKAGARVTLIAEQASISALRPFLLEVMRSFSKLRQGAALRLTLLGVPYRFGCWVSSAEGDGRLQSVTIRQGNRTWSEPCDYAGIAYGLTPNTEIAALLGCTIIDGAVLTDSQGRTSLPDVFCAGEVTGIAGVEAALLRGDDAASAACGQPTRGTSAYEQFARNLKVSFALRPELRALCYPDTVVCRCEDVTYAQLKGYSSFRAAKLHARCGMGPCQARTCGPALEFLFGWKTDSVRPPLYPARLGSLTEIEEIASSQK